MVILFDIFKEMQLLPLLFSQVYRLPLYANVQGVKERNICVE